jgi:tetratricopeptide (TPR) repeat protein
MTKLHRRDLKQDEVREKVAEAVKSVSLHGREVLYIILIVIAVAGIAVAWFFYERSQQQASQNLLGLGLEKLSAPVAQPQTDPNMPKPAFNFNTEAEKYRAAVKDFEKVAAEYGNTPAADQARYLAGVCYFYLNDHAKAEQLIKQSSRVSDRNIIYYQSRIALAELYNKTNRSQQAIEVLKEALKPSKSQVPKDFLLLQLAASYEKAGKNKEARDTYQQIATEYKDSPASFESQQKLDQLK